jgi:phosphomannomutase/phosphoglucomutase
MSFLETDAIKEQVTTYSRLVKDSAGQPIAVLLVSFPLSAISTAFKSFSPDAGRIELTQIIGKERAAIINAGQGLEGNTLTASTANPSWELTFSPSSLLGSAADELQLILIIAIAAVLVVIALFAWVLIALGRLVNTDAIAISRFSRKWLLEGDRQRPTVAISELASLVSELDLQGDEVRSQRGIKILPPADGLGDLSVASDASLLGDAPTPKSNGSGTSRIAVPPVKPAAAEPQRPALDATIFRAYDVRGIVGKGLTKDVVEALGCAIGSEAYARGDSTVVVGRDGRISGPEMSAALISGLRKSGVDVIDVGMVPTPVLYFAAKTIANGSGVMVTGSHNPANYNGFKIMLAGDTLAGDEIQALRQRIESGNFTTGSGGLRQESVTQDYIDRVSTDIALARPLRVVLDAGNGVAGAIGPRVLEELGCMVTPLFCEVDGNFPNHHPDPSKPENLQDLIAAVAANNADIGIAFDGDGDRIGVVTSKGNSIFADRLMMLYAKHMLTTNPGADIIFDVKCSRDLPALISRLGGRPVMCKTGHSFIKGKLKETNAPLAGEMSGHIFFNDRWFGFDDALYSAARLLEILSLELGDSDEMFAEFPENFTTPEINIAVEDERKFDVMDALINSANFQEGNVITIDGIRVEFSDSWGLVRASNTSPCLVARFEGKTPEALAAVQAKFKTLLKQVDSNLTIPF